MRERINVAPAQRRIGGVGGQVLASKRPRRVSTSWFCLSPVRMVACLMACWVWLGPGALPSLAGYSSIYVFGDSLSAVSGGGRQYPPPPATSADNYWHGRFSNGRVWVEYLADLEGINFNPNHDFSFFGGGSPAIYRTLFFGNYYPPPDLATSLCIFWPACSDCFDCALFHGTNSWSPYLSAFVTNVTASVGLLYSQGMRTVLIPNSVDVSLVPFFTYTLGALGFDTAAPFSIQSWVAAIHTNVIQYNAALATAIGQMRAQYPDLTIYAPDFYTQFNFFLNHPEIYGVTKTGMDALEDQALTDKSFNGSGADYVFWDYLHPTTKVHWYMATVARQAMSSLMISRLSLQDASFRLDLMDLPISRTGTVESTRNLVSPTVWVPRASFLVTNPTQTVFISTNGLGSRGFFRLNFPP